MYPEKKGGSHKMARPQQNWGLLTLLIRWASIWTMPNTASPKSEPPCGRAVYTPVRATILGHPPQKTAPGGPQGRWVSSLMHICIIKLGYHLVQAMGCHLFNTLRPKQNGRSFADNIFKCIFMNANAFQLRLQWSLFLWVQLMIKQHWFR